MFLFQTENMQNAKQSASQKQVENVATLLNWIKADYNTLATHQNQYGTKLVEDAAYNLFTNLRKLRAIFDDARELFDKKSTSIYDEAAAMLDNLQRAIFGNIGRNNMFGGVSNTNPLFGLAAGGTKLTEQFFKKREQNTIPVDLASYTLRINGYGDKLSLSDASDYATALKNNTDAYSRNPSGGITEKDLQRDLDNLKAAVNTLHNFGKIDELAYSRLNSEMQQYGNPSRVSSGRNSDMESYGDLDQAGKIATEFEKLTKTGFMSPVPEITAHSQARMQSNAAKPKKAPKPLPPEYVQKYGSAVDFIRSISKNGSGAKYATEITNAKSIIDRVVQKTTEMNAFEGVDFSKTNLEDLDVQQRRLFLYMCNLQVRGQLGQIDVGMDVTNISAQDMADADNSITSQKGKDFQMEIYMKAYGMAGPMSSAEMQRRSPPESATKADFADWNAVQEILINPENDVGAVFKKTVSNITLAMQGEYDSRTRQGGYSPGTSDEVPARPVLATIQKELSDHLQETFEKKPSMTRQDVINEMNSYADLLNLG